MLRQVLNISIFVLQASLQVIRGKLEHSATAQGPEVVHDLEAEAARLSGEIASLQKQLGRQASSAREQTSQEEQPFRDEPNPQNFSIEADSRLQDELMFMPASLSSAEPVLNDGGGDHSECLHAESGPWKMQGEDSCSRLISACVFDLHFPSLLSDLLMTGRFDGP